MDDGSVWSCGRNYQGRLCDGTTYDRCVLGPTKIINCRQVAVGDSGIALMADGTVWSWGSNSYGTRGYIGADSLILSPIPNMSNVKLISCSITNCYAIKEDGSIWAWGKNENGSLGDGSNEMRYVPVLLQGFPINIVAIVSSCAHTLALDDQGKVWAWGCNRNGQLGNGLTSDSYTPVQVPIDQVIAIDCGSSSSYALKEDGTVWAWGYNEICNLGIGNNTDMELPVQVSGLTDVVSISIGYNPMALKRDGTVWAWGLGTAVFGKNTNYGYLKYDVPEKVNIDDAIAISSGSSYIVKKRDGSIWAWGRNERGQLGIGLFDRGEEDDRWGIYTPTKILEPGSTPIPVVNPTPTFMSTPTLIINETDNNIINESDDSTLNNITTPYNDTTHVSQYPVPIDTQKMNNSSPDIINSTILSTTGNKPLLSIDYIILFAILIIFLIAGVILFINIDEK
jgi:alpha-tubulin suppressor-like RCC1 family protein